MCTEQYIPHAVYDSISLITKTHVNVTKAALPAQANSWSPTQHPLSGLGGYMIDLVLIVWRTLCTLGIDDK